MNRRNIPVLFLLVSFFSVAMFSCKREADDKYKNDPSKGFFPVKVGHYVDYNLDSFIYDDFTCLTLDKHYQVRYLTADTFTDNQGRTSYRVETYMRKYDTLSWQTDKVHYFTPTATSLEYVENTLRFIKLVYPIENGRTWNGNAMIATNDPDLTYFADWNYKYMNYGQEYQQDSVFFGNTVVVQHIDEQQNDPGILPEAYSYKTFSREVYAYDIGMVYKELTHWIYDPGVKKCKKGYKVIWRAVGHN